MSQDGAQGRYEGRSVGGGRYELRDLLGAGGMASVHLAHDSVLDRDVAIKTLHTELGREAAFRERFRREAQAVARLAHTNIVSVYDSGEDTLPGGADGAGGGVVPYIVMEYVAGDPLRAVLDADIAAHGAMPAEKALRITADVLSALDASHEVNLVHRDIKPGNVMVTPRGVVKVMDFGIARAMQSGVTSMTQTGMVVGTPQYLSPEQALGRGVDARADLYSVGIMLFELVTGRLPFDADSPLAIAYAHVQEDPPVPSGINRSLPAGVDALISRTLRKNPGERFPTAAAMREECLRLAGSGQSGATPLIIGEGPRARTSGAAVSSAVFPAASPTTPPPPSVQQPYQPTQAAFGPAHPQASTPPPPSMPTMPTSGYASPHLPHQPGPAYNGMRPSGPPPYSAAPTPPPGPPRKNNTAVVVISVIVGVVLLTALAVGIGLSVGGGDTPSDDSSPAPLTSSSTSADGSGDDGSGDQGGSTGGVNDNGKVAGMVMKTTDCTDAAKSAANPGSILVPSFTGKTLASAQACMKAAGWKFVVRRAPDYLYARDVISSSQPSIDWWNPRTGSPIVLHVATGRSPN